ncbi:hypothetical protein RHSIM_Rhsim05G0020700 [Rhododendron simsii]|uniref:Uncharacterized protein n=1 Tax=Rhododendron simsii TaxID=118357 RepID=A0A834LP72_RHOSS|nr:hypothetical protein RHSIM_Rhsim05G0020700 [Rhododendron simsii]
MFAFFLSSVSPILGGLKSFDYGFVMRLRRLISRTWFAELDGACIAKELMYMNLVFSILLGGISFRRGLHRTILHLDLNLAEPILRHLRFPLRCLRDPSRKSCPVGDRAMLLPVVQRRFLLVAESLFDLTAGSSALYLFSPEISMVVFGILYFGYMLLGTYSFFVLAGTIGFYACLWLTKKLTSNGKLTTYKKFNYCKMES